VPRGDLIPGLSVSALHAVTQDVVELSAGPGNEVVREGVAQDDVTGGVKEEGGCASAVGTESPGRPLFFRDADFEHSCGARV
jgi:hypothetical protein